MVLKYLEMQGFKSFPDKTKVSFGRGLTAVVGPNGSGKSNISDAVRWVMGEQSTKTLRGEKMEDVIFKGTTGSKSRKAQGFAEVSLTVDNSNREFEIDSDEVTITRKYYRSGESEYMINRSNVRLKDINEIFMDTGLGKDGYSLVGQGKIAEIVQSKSNERREIFEEAAGISKFRYRKNESERNLARAEENLSRLRDILNELEGRIEPLKEQSEKAKKFIDFADRKKVLEVSIWNDTMERSNQLLKDQSDKILASTTSREQIENEIETIEINISTAYEQMQQCLVSIENKRKQKSELEAEIADITSQIAVCNNNIEHNIENEKRIANEIENHLKANENTENEILQKQMKIDEISEKINQLNVEIKNKQDELFLKTSEFQNADVHKIELADKLNTLLLSQNEIKMTMAQTKNNLEEITASIERNNLEHNAISQEIQKFKANNLLAKDAIQSLNAKYESLQNSCSGHKLKLDNRSNKLDDIKKECETTGLKIKEKQQKARMLESLENSHEGFYGSVKEVLKRAQNGILNGIEGTLSQLIDVKSEYSTAIETALGGSLQNIVVTNESCAKSAIKLLKQENLGRATFLPLTTIGGSIISTSGMENYAGFVDVASNLVKYDAKFKSIIDSFLGRVIIVDDIDTATIIAQKYGFKFKIVTLDGQVVNAGGSFTGGSKNKSQGFLSRKNEIQQLNNEIITITSGYQNNLKQMEILSAEVNQINAEFTAISSEMQTLTEDKIRLEAEENSLKQMLLQDEQRFEKMQVELLSKYDKQKALIDILSQNNSDLVKVNLEVEELSNELNSLKENSVNSVDIQTSLANELSNLKISTIELNKDIELNKQVIEELLKQQQLANNNSQELQEQRAKILENNISISEEIEMLKNSIELQKKEISSFDEQTDKIMQRRLEYEKQTNELRQKSKVLADEKEKLASETVRLEERHFAMKKEYDEIIAKLFDEYELTRTEAQSFAISLESIPKANAELNSLKLKIRNLGSVNVAAIEEYKEVSERYEFLNSQISDAEKSKGELLKLINDLTQKMQDIFLDNFIKINDNFKSIFVELFGGGHAELKLTDPDNLLESGIEIIAEPPGKIQKSLISLSGGEQSFIAIAIYFAILKVHPAPFCILDEIEAALDDVNVVKYASYLRSMSDKTQFIMITHRRGSMEAADVLYGVTMQEDGVSKLLQLNVSEIENSNILNEVN